jgi:hypothetical protein
MCGVTREDNGNRNGDSGIGVFATFAWGEVIRQTAKKRTWRYRKVKYF